MPSNFNIVLASPSEHRELVAEIYIDGKFVALISEERGSGLFDLETPGAGLVETNVTRRVDLPRFMAAVEQACKQLSAR